MTTIAEEALDGLAAALASLLPDEDDPARRPALTIVPRRIAPSGVGGFVGLHDDPEGEIHGRRVEAEVVVRVSADDAAALPAAVTSVTRALLTPDRSTLAAEGIHRIELAEMGPVSNGDAAGRELTFAVRYEFLRLPSATEGVIEAIPLDLDVSVGPREPRTILRSAFTSRSLDWFEPVDDPAATAGGPSEWVFEPEEARLAQRTRIGGGSTAAQSPNKPGTYLLLRTTKRRPPVRDLALRALVGSDDTGGIGLVYRRQEDGDFYFFLMHGSGGYRLLGKKVSGSFAHLETPALDTTKGFSVGGTHRLKLVAIGSRHEVWIDGEQALVGEDDAIGAAGRVGFLSHRNQGSFFYEIGLTEL